MDTDNFNNLFNNYYNSIVGGGNSNLEIKEVLEKVDLKFVEEFLGKQLPEKFKNWRLIDIIKVGDRSINYYPTEYTGIFKATGVRWLEEFKLGIISGDIEKEIMLFVSPEADSLYGITDYEDIKNLILENLIPYLKEYRGRIATYRQGTTSTAIKPITFTTSSKSEISDSTLDGYFKISADNGSGLYMDHLGKLIYVKED